MTESDHSSKNSNIKKINERRKNLLIRIVGAIGCIASQFHLIPVSEEIYNSFYFLVIEFGFLCMLFYKVNVKKWNTKIRILVILFILLELGINIYFQLYK